MNLDKLLNYFKLDKEEFYFQFNSHPNYPSALAFSDTFNFMGIMNDTYELEKKYWEELPQEFIALVNDSFSLVKRKENHYLVYSDKIEKVIKDDLYKNSENFILLFKQNETIKESTFSNFKFVVYIFLSIALLFSFFQFEWYESVFNILSLLGIYISVEIFNQKYGNQSMIINTICGGTEYNSSKSSCDKIFSSDKINIFGLKLSDFSLIYFLGALVVGLLFPNTQFVFKIMSLISILVILYSLYVQAYVERSICRVCLIIISILISQIVISLSYFNWNVFPQTIFGSVIILFMIFFTTIFISNLLNSKEEINKVNIKNLRFKRNYDLFKRQLLDREKIKFEEESLFFLGNKDAKLHISIISNPYCGFCKGAHKIVDHLLKKYSNNVSAQIRFNYFSESSDIRLSSLLSNLINIYKTKSENEFLKSIEEWFEFRDEEKIKAKVDINSIENLNPLIQISQENKNAGLNFTPIFLLNGYQFPERYEREDLYYFIDELIEDEEI